MNKNELLYEMQNEIENRVTEITKLDGLKYLDTIEYGFYVSAKSLAHFALKSGIFDYSWFTYYIEMIDNIHREYKTSIK